MTHFTPLRWLILGGGAIVTEYHLPAIKALGGLGDCLVVEPSARNIAHIREYFPSVQVMASSYESVVSDRDRLRKFDAALIALPNSMHGEATIRCIEAGLSVLCEKPLALTAADCVTVADLSEKKRRLVAVGMVRRFMPSLAALRQAITANMVGEIRSIGLQHGGRFTWPSDTETVFRRDQGGCLVNMGIHFLDYLRWIFGPLTPVSYRDDFAGGIEVNCDFELLTTAQAPVNLRISWTDSLANVLTVNGTQGKLTMPLDQFEVCHWNSVDNRLESVIRSRSPFESGDWRPTFASCFVEQLWRFSRALLDPTEGNALVKPRDIVHCHELVDWAYSTRSGGGVASQIMTEDRPSLSPAPVVVTGGTGFIGGHLTKRLAALGFDQITVPVRSFMSGANIARYPVKMKRIDLLDLESCCQALRGAKHAFHLAYGTSGPEAARITIQGTRNILEAAKREGAESVVVFVLAPFGGMCATQRLMRQCHSILPWAIMGKQKPPCS